MTLRNLSDEEKQEINNLDLTHEDMYKMLKAQPDIEIKNITIEALFKDDDLLAVTPQFDDISNLEAVNILLNVLVADAKQNTDIENFIKTIISMWGTYDEAEGKL
ncbi:hypothetical protein J3S97_11260 [Lactococcus cremoris]|uniref:hypothetical protein n=1 Tax=Lactococcus lactis subsp. cremoris TaxID=1359 RepID=UPI00038B8F60|nr:MULTISPECIES: hypothetical protein [Lactococcus]EQC55048.1 hypothetical protein LLT5_03875 [Lactococcus cremoris subsp. cremoris TIFN5]EQC88729.1 hypothetical protein LLT1_04030 [Lactococcus cremoris subsp. cremoris TIFN1]AXN66262.1 hypothetical protein L3107_2074 [Lactococcus cremoris]MRM50279.1 hypothetical protein [Lactococcus cremoris]OAJ97765.1 hypothetical protein A7U61_04825 [Lactococcus lactis]